MITAHCPTCSRDLYIEDRVEPVCPVCATALLAAETPAEARDRPANDGGEPGSVRSIVSG